jgi:hypothetical protein
MSRGSGRGARLSPQRWIAAPLATSVPRVVLRQLYFPSVPGAGARHAGSSDLDLQSLGRQMELARANSARGALGPLRPRLVGPPNADSS